jgi:hypothetical protein
MEDLEAPAAPQFSATTAQRRLLPQTAVILVAQAQAVEQEPEEQTLLLLLTPVK